MINILLVEDDPEIVNLLMLHFDPAVYSLFTCPGVAAAMEKVAVDHFELMILDIGLPDGNGLELCKSIRQNNNNIPILMLTCHSQEADKVLALELGADDYITKPFGVLELLARVKAIIRRTKPGQVAGSVPETEIRFNELVIDPVKKKVSLAGKRLDLTVKEFDLLWLLARNPGKTFARKDLLEEIWGYSFEGYEHTITSHINRLRIKLEPDLSHPSYILTAWGAGYRFAE